MKKKKGFTLVELLAVIVILAVILVIAVPKIMDTITNAKEGTFVSSAKLIASQAEKKYVENQVLGITDTIECSDVSKTASSDYDYCNITFDSDGKASVTLTGKGKFEGMAVCDGSKTEGVLSDNCYTDSACFAYEELKTVSDFDIVSYDACVNYFLGTAYVSENNTSYLSVNDLTDKIYVMPIEQAAEPEVPELIDAVCKGDSYQGETLKDIINYGYINVNDLEDSGAIGNVVYGESLGAIITGYDYENESCGSDVLVPNSINGAPVIEIGGYAFTIEGESTDGVTGTSNAKNNKYNIMPLGSNAEVMPIVSAGPEKIGVGITSVRLPNTIEYIGMHAFDGNDITGTLDLSNLAKLTNIGEYAFSLNQISTIKLPSEISYIGNYAFSNNSLSGTLNLGGYDKLTSIMGHAFENNQITSVVLPDNLKYIWSFVFQNNRITSVSFPKELIEINQEAFYNNNITGILDLRKCTKLEYVGFASFQDNDISSVILPSSVKTISNYALADNDISGKIDFNNVTSLEIIAQYAFYNNDITSVILPGSLINIGKYAFMGNSLNNITLGNQNLTYGVCAFGHVYSSATHNLPASYPIGACEK